MRSFSMHNLHEFWSDSESGKRVHEDASFSNLRLPLDRLTNTVFRRCLFSNVLFEGDAHTPLTIVDSTLQHCSLDRTGFERLSLTGCQLENVTFRGCPVVLQPVR